MNNLVEVNSKELEVKEFRDKRVVTLKEIDDIHERADGTARRNFNTNKKHLIEDVDFFKVCADEIRTHKIMDISNKVREDVTLITESGYLMLVKSFTDDLAWDVQRDLVNKYFRVKENTSLNTQGLSPTLQVLINLELEQKQIKQDIADNKQEIQGIRDVVALNSTNWKADSSRIISSIAGKLGDFSHIKEIRNEIYEQLEQRMACRLNTRLIYKRKTMAENGVCKSKRDKLSKLDVIADDKKLIEGYVAIVKEMAIKYGVANTLN